MNKRMEEAKKKFQYFATYSVLFAILAMAIFAIYYIRGNSFVWKEDGINQHYQALAYIGEWLREWFSTGKMPMWDFNLGQGVDVLSTFNYYGIGDLLTLTSAFVPVRYTEYLYMLLIFVRMYLAGIAFSLFAFEMKKGYRATLAGALNYSFCGYALQVLARHPFFLNPMIYLPLLLMGSERILKKKKPTLFMVMVCISAISNFYFFYMLVIGVVVYVVARYLTLEEKSVSHCLRMVGRFFGYAVVGVMMAAVLLLPVILLFLNTYRGDVEVLMDNFYTENYYRQMIKGFLFPMQVGNYGVLGFTLPALVAVILLFVRQKGCRMLKILVLGTSLMYVFPIAAKVMNGFSYPSNRWGFLYAMLISYVLTFMWQEMMTCVRKYKSVLQTALLAFICLNLVYNIGYCYKDSALKYVSIGKCYKFLQSSAAKAAKDTDREDVYSRYETDYAEPQNAGALTQMPSVDFFYSLVPAERSQRYMELDMLHNYTYKFTNNNYRTFVNATSSVGYFVQKKSSTPVPYGYEKISETKKGTYNIYKNFYTLPLGYTTANYIARETYEQMSSADKQEAMLQGVVLDETKKIQDDYKESQLTFTSQEIPFTIEKTKNVSVDMEKGTFYASKKNATITLKVKTIPNSETYVCIKGMEARTSEEHWTATKQLLLIDFRAEGYKTTLRYYTPYHIRPNGQTDYLVNLGYRENSYDTITITFRRKARGTFDDFSVYAQPMTSYPSQIEELRKESLQDVCQETNYMSGKITVSEDKLLCLTIPYDKGWKAYVDGKETDILKANTMYMALPLEAGEHKIELRYCTYGFKLGLAVSIVGFAAFVVIILMERRKKLQNQGGKI